MCCNSHPEYEDAYRRVLEAQMERTFRSLLRVPAPYQARLALTWAPAPVPAPAEVPAQPVREVVTIS